MRWGLVMAVSDDFLRSEIARLGPWHHDVELRPGVRTGDPSLGGDHPAEIGSPSVTDPFLEMRDLADNLFPQGFAGRSFLDCACNAGGHAFAARSLGAGRVYGFDARPHWIEQAHFLQRHLGGADMQFEALQLSELPSIGLKPFDITKFRGIFYHLPDPVTGLRIAADLTNEIIIVNSASQPSSKAALMLNPESTTQLMSGIHGLAWMPSGPDVVQAILTHCGFRHSRVRYDITLAPGQNRFEIVAAREESSLAYFDATRSTKAAARVGLLSRVAGRIFRNR
jgi:SAM-dependent methyltransferase